MNWLLLFFLFIFVSWREKETLASPQVDVVAFEVQPSKIPSDHEFVGVTKSSHPVEIRSRVEGYLISIDYTEGSLVNPGDLMFRIDPREFEASVIEAEGALARQKAILWRAQKAVERTEPLYEKNAASLRDLENAIAAQLAAEASVITAEGNLIKAKLNLSYTFIQSPIRGMSGRALFQVGSLITPSVNGLLSYVSIIDPIWVYFNVTSSELMEMRNEKAQERLVLPTTTEDYTVTLKLGDGTTYPYTGKVNFTSPILDPQTGTMSVRAEFPNPQEDLLPGQFVTAKVAGAYMPDALLVPQSAVFQGREGLYVFVINSDCSLSKRLVVTGAWYKNYWVIKEGLCAGDLIVGEGVNRIHEGAKVNVTQVEKFTAEKEKEERFLVAA